MEKIPFKERVKNIAIDCAVKYTNTFCNYEYLMISNAFAEKYVKIHADKDNYMHLLGINSNLSASDFYNKCIKGTLTTNDFDFKKKNQSEKSTKGSVREKIVALPLFCNMFSAFDIECQQNFSKGKVSCSFASASNKYTIGFVATGRPMTLMKNNQLDKNKSKPVIAVQEKKKALTLSTTLSMETLLVTKTLCQKSTKSDHLHYAQHHHITNSPQQNT